MDKPKSNKWMIAGMIFFAAMGGMLYGYDIGILSGALLFIQNDIPMSTFQESLLGGAILGGGAFAILVCGYLADIYGRKRMIMVSGIVFIVSVGIIYFANSYETLFAGRLIQGISVGFISITVPLYLTETAPAKIRGMAVVAFQLMLTFGIVLANLVSLAFTSSGNWRGMFLTALVPAVIMFVGSFFLVKSPRWLLFRGREKEALSSLLKIRSHKEAHTQYAEIKASMAKMKDNRGFFSYFSEKKYFTPMIIVFSIAILAQLTGINSFLQFSAKILSDAGFTSNFMAVAGSSLIAAINLIATVIAIFIADRFERKHLVAFGTAGVTIVLILSGIVLGFVPASPLKGYLMLCGLLLFIFFFAAGPGALVWIIMSELLPTAVRSKGLAVALFLNSLASAILASVFLPAASVIGIGGMFIFCGVCTFVYFLVATFYIPNTKNKSLEEIEAGFAEKAERANKPALQPVEA